MSYVRKKGEKGQYRVIDSKCLGRECLQPGEYHTRGGTLSGSRNTGNVSLCCLQNAYRGCPDTIPDPDPELLKKRKTEGWKNA